MKKTILLFCMTVLLLYSLFAESVNLAPDVTAEMLNANYWVAKADKPFDVVMPLEDIALFNKKICSCYSDNNAQYKLLYDLRTFGNKVSSSFIREKMKSFFPGETDYYHKNADGNISLITNDEWQSWYNLMQYPELSARSGNVQCPVRKAIFIKRTELHSFPVEDFFSSDSEYWFDNELVQTSVLMNMPILVLWESADAQWYFVQCEYYAGWVKKENVALVSDAEFARYFDYENRKQKDFIVITENRYTIEEKYYIPSGCKEPVQDLFMGTILNLVDWNSNPMFMKTFAPREPHSSFLVEIPYKKADESLGFRYAAVSAGACSKGFLPYTQANVLTLAFKPLGDRYGWGGMAESTDCSGLVLEVYRCFGFHLARDTSGQCCMPGKILFVAEAPTQEKKLVCRTLPAGAIMYFKGHMFLFIGCENNLEYVLSSVGAYYSEQKDVRTFSDAESVSINTLDVQKKNGKTWGDNLERIILLTEPDKYPGVNVK